MTQPPHVPDYATPPQPLTPPNRPNQLAARSLLIGLGIGTAVSIVIWLTMWLTIENANWLWLLLAVPLVKTGVSIYLIVRDRRSSLPRFRFAGIGLLMSIPLGALIFFGTCFVALIGRGR